MNYDVVTQAASVKSCHVDSPNCQVIACAVSNLTSKIYGDQEAKITVYPKCLVNLALTQTQGNPDSTIIRGALINTWLSVIGTFWTITVF